MANAACLVTIPVLDAGRYDAHGDHYWWVEGIETGDYSSCCETPPYRSFFVFNVPQLTQAVLSASLKIDAWTVLTDDSFETLELRAVTADVAAVRAGGTGRSDIYAALASGPVWGECDFTTYDSGHRVDVPLNSVFLSAINAAKGGWLTFGGSVATLDAIPFNRETLFAFGLYGSSVDYAFNHVFLELELEPVGRATIVYPPQSENVLAGSSATLRVEVCGEGTLAYQWQRDGVDIPGANASAFLIENAAQTNAGNYRVIAQNSFGAVTSSVAVVSVQFIEPYFSYSPSDAEAFVDCFQGNESGIDDPPGAASERSNHIRIVGQICEARFFNRNTKAMPSEQRNAKCRRSEQDIREQELRPFQIEKRNYADKLRRTPCGDYQHAQRQHRCDDDAAWFRNQPAACAIDASKVMMRRVVNRSDRPNVVRRFFTEQPLVTGERLFVPLTELL